MQRILSTVFLAIYSGILIKVMVFKDVPMVRVGQMLINFGGKQEDRPANFIPFKTILPYILGDKGYLIAGINLVGNIVFLVPVGFFLPLIYRKMNWKIAVIIALLSGLSIELLQVILHVGIFDIDDLILNGLGVMVGYGACRILAKWLQEKRYLMILLSFLMVILMSVVAVYAILPHGKDVVGPGTSNRMNTVQQKEGAVPESGDLCGGTGGNGEILRVNDTSFLLKLNTNKEQTVHLAKNAEINTPKGTGTVTDLKLGDRVTLVGGPNPDGSFTADAIFICSK